MVCGLRCGRCAFQIAYRCFLLWLCCGTDDNKVEIRLLGGLPPIIECLEIQDVRTRRDALRTLCNLSIDAENKKELRPLGGLRSIADCLLTDDAETKRYALACLINLSNDGMLVAICCVVDLP